MHEVASDSGAYVPAREGAAENYNLTSQIPQEDKFKLSGSLKKATRTSSKHWYWETEYGVLPDRRDFSHP